MTRHAAVNSRLCQLVLSASRDVCIQHSLKTFHYEQINDAYIVYDEMVMITLDLDGQRAVLDHRSDVSRGSLNSAAGQQRHNEHQASIAESLITHVCTVIMMM